MKCDLCGARRRSNEIAWVERMWGEQVPMCADDCARRADPNTCVHEDHLALCKRCEDADRRARENARPAW